MEVRQREGLARGGRGTRAARREGTEGRGARALAHAGALPPQAVQPAAHPPAGHRRFGRRAAPHLHQPLRILFRAHHAHQALRVQRGRACTVRG
eukprot:853957-Prymnesium_polylepis.1